MAGNAKILASKVLVLNSGSSSLKFKLFREAVTENTGRKLLQVAASGQVERIGDPQNSKLIFQGGELEYQVANIGPWLMTACASPPQACRFAISIMTF